MSCLFEPFARSGHKIVQIRETQADIEVVGSRRIIYFLFAKSLKIHNLSSEFTNTDSDWIVVHDLSVKQYAHSWSTDLGAAFAFFTFSDLVRRPRASSLFGLELELNLLLTHVQPTVGIA